MFLLLTAAVSAASRRPAFVPRPRPTGRLRFDLDEQRRWSLWYLGAGQPVPLVRNATLGAWIADRFVALGELEYSTAGSVRPSRSQGIVIRGRAAGVFIEARFLSGPADGAPAASVALNIFPDRERPSIGGVRFFQVPQADVLPGTGGLVTLLDAADAETGPTADAERASGALAGLTRAGSGMALGFAPTDPGVGTVRLSDAGLEATSDWTPPRPLRPEGDTSELRLSFDPEGDGMEALRALFTPASPVDQERLSAVPVPAGWCSRPGMTAADVLEHVALCAERFGRRSLRVIVVGEGYERFPGGHRSLTDRIHAQGFEAGLRIAGGRDSLPDLARRAVHEWGYDYLELDLQGGTPREDLTRAEVYRLGLLALRASAGTDAYLVGTGAPFQHSLGLLNAMRVVPPATGDWGGIKARARAASLRHFYDRAAWLNELGRLEVGPPLEPAAAQTWTSIVAVLGGLALMGDDLRTLSPERMTWLERTLPVAPSPGRPVRAATEAPDSARVWCTAGAPLWWTVVLVNWDDTPATVSVPLVDIGLDVPTRCNTYDVWRNAPLEDTADALTVSLEPRSSATIALRPWANRPQVIGTTRHIVQGAVDLREEAWDPSSRTLSGRAVALDRRPYAITIAVPQGLEPKRCVADAPCALRQLDSGHAVIELVGDRFSTDISWQLAFARRA